jgi:undecaprenyl phosphate-alpha-L-ara4FN deformylase
MQLALKIDVDTYDGIASGAARLASFLHSQKIPASFFVSLGPDNSGRAATRVFRQPGFLKKMWRTKAVSVYGWRTALSGTLFPARPMGTSFGKLFRQWRTWGFEVSPHGYDHILWHDEAATWDEGRAAQELEKLGQIYRYIFGEDPTSFAAPGWQAGWGTWRAMEKINLLYHSDTRGESPYFPIKKSSSPAATSRGSMDSPPTNAGNDSKGELLKTLEIPTTLPTWDEMLAWDGMKPEALAVETLKRLDPNRLNVWTLHAEIEGTVFFPRFHEFVEDAEREGVEWVFLPRYAKELLSHPKGVPCDTMKQGTLPGRAGTVTCQHG